MATQFNTFQNNAYATLASAYAAGSGSLVLATGSGAQFGSTFPIRVTAVTATSYRGTAEVLTIFTVSGRSVDTLTGVAAVEGTTDRAYAVGAIVEMRWTAGEANQISSSVNAIENAPYLTPASSISNAQLPTGAMAYAPTPVKTSAYNAVVGDLVPVDTTAGNITVTLPTAPADRARIAVKQVVRGGTNTVTIQAGGSDVFNTTGGTNTKTLTLASQAIQVEYSAAAAIWYVIADDLPLSGLDGRYCQTANNLNDVVAATARTNLGLGTLATTSSYAIGTAVSGGGASRILYEDGSSNLGASANLGYNGTTLTVGGSSNGAVQVTGMVPAFGALMTANNAPAPQVALASTETNSSNAAWMAFDNNSGTNWLASTTTGWIQIDLGSGNAVACTGYSVQAGNGSNIGYTATAWTVAGSNDGTTFTTLDTQTGITWTNSQIRAFTFANATAYRYYRLTATANNGWGLVGVAAFTPMLAGSFLSVTSSQVTMANVLAPLAIGGPVTIAGALTATGNLSVAGGTLAMTGSTLTIPGGSTISGTTSTLITLSAAGPSAITVNAGIGVILGYAFSASQYSSSALAGDIVCRSIGTSNRILYGVDAGTAIMAIGGVAVATAGVMITPYATTQVGIAVTGMAGQTGDLQQWRNSTPTTLARVTAAGELSGPIAPAYTALSGTSTLTAGQCIVAVSAASGWTLTLPAANAVQVGHMYVIKKTDANSNAITVTAAGSDTIDAAATYVLNAQWQYVRINSNGGSPGNWMITGVGTT